MDLAAGVIRVERGWDAAEGEIAPKSSAGRRKVPITGILRDYLLAHKLATDGEGLVFSNRFPDRPFSSVASQKRADKAWKAAGLGRLTLHECRHGYASFMIDAGINAKAERARAADSGETGAFTGASVAQAPEKALD